MNKKIISFFGLIVAGGACGWFLNELNSSLTTQSISLSATTSSQQQESTTVTDAFDFVSARPAIVELPKQELSVQEHDRLIYMREEEKLARDVYSILYEKWRMPIFSNIAQSEQTHTEAVQDILTKYNITDPVTHDSVGVFTNSNLQELYNNLTARGITSREEALTVGALIEDLDIADLKRNISETDNDDITLVYENLMRGSRNHLRSFTTQLVSLNTVYTPQYISKEEFDEIIASPQERGMGTDRRGWGKTSGQ